ncbi:NAR1 ribosyltransferase, partial [Ptilonorhynchus violaceus]|nr:NAR1 ribosyltransferase [Ptilonorhynchus violaceus]
SMGALARTLALLAMTVATAAIEEVPLDMAPDSFDDQYDGCRDKMNAALVALSHSDIQGNGRFAEVWTEARNEWQSRGSPTSPLVPAQAIALMAYTMNNLYKEFNAAVREAGRSSRHYRDNFHYKTLHFLLTDALATLRAARGQKHRCVFRRVREVRFKAQPGQRVRFGQFASSSLCKDLRLFGSDTVFQVNTSYGADIHNFSYYPGEQEVLIPPFETFNVTKVTRDGDGVRIWLNSTGTHSNYSCELLPGDGTGTAWG